MKYTELTIGDGIVSQIGSLLMAMSAGVIVTRVFDGSDDNVAVGIFKELMQNSVVVYTLAAMFILMGVFSRCQRFRLSGLASCLVSSAIVRNLI